MKSVDTLACFSGDSLKLLEKLSNFFIRVWGPEFFHYSAKILAPFDLFNRSKEDMKINGVYRQVNTLN